MIAALLLGLLAPLQAAPTPASDDIVVTGQRRERLRRLRMVTRTDRRTGITRCVFKRRSGDRQLDDGVCAAALACAARVRTEAEIVPCVAPAMEALVAGAAWQAGRGR